MSLELTGIGLHIPAIRWLGVKMGDMATIETFMVLR